jgi:salicylate 5-hydroxylase small subunit
MNVEGQAPTVVDHDTRWAIEELYAQYAACLDDGRLEEWPNLFVDDCRYILIPRENYEAGHLLATMSFESKAMLRDRIYGARHTLFHAPYYQRHLIGPKRIRGNGSSFSVEANYLVIRTKRSEPSELLNAGRYVDEVVPTSEGMRFTVKRCVFDTELVPNSIIYPI